MTFPVLSAGTSAYNLQRSLRFRSSATAYLSRTPGSTGNRQIFTWSGWVKRGTLGNQYQNIFGAGAIGSGGGDPIYFQNDVIAFYVNGGFSGTLVTTQVFRDPSAWYHFVFSVDTTQATAANRIRMYVNGVQITAFSTATYPAQNYNFTQINNSGAVQYLGSGYLNNFDGYMTEINFIDGQALTPSSFGSTNAVTGVWQPAKYTGTYGTNGFYLPFTNLTSTSTLGNDFSGNSNNWTTNNISLTAGVTYDSMTDVPTLTSPNAANFAVMNPLDNGGLTITGANLDSSRATASWLSDRCTFGLSSSKWYWEFTATSVVDVSNGHMLALMKSTANLGSYPGGDANGWGYFSSNGQKYTNGAAGVAYGSSWTNGDVIGVAFDADNGTLVFYKNNVSQGTAYTGLTNGPYFPALGLFGTATGSFNFGQRPFAYTPPSGFVALNTFNLPSSTIPAGNKYMDATLYTGDGTNNRTITSSLGFTPGLAWGKSRSAAVQHALIDSVRGNYQTISSNSTAAESAINSYNLSTANTLITWNSNETNQNGSTYVAWLWAAGGTAVTNTSGSITSTVSANTTSGFSVVTYTANGTNGATVGHGLNVTPAIYIVKRRNTTGNWVVVPGNSSLLGGSFYLQLNTTSAVISNSDVFTSYPGPSVFYLSTNADVNASGGTYVAYCFTPIAGFSAFGSYTGNGSADGPFIYTGFRPRWIMFKRTNSTGNWVIFDTARGTYNQTPNGLFPDLSDAEDSSSIFDLLSNGFKARSSGSAYNVNGGAYIYAAFAENPFKNALAR